MQEPAIPSLQEKGYDCRYFLKMHGQYSFQFNQKHFLEWEMPVDFQSLFFISKDKRGGSTYWQRFPWTCFSENWDKSKILGKILTDTKWWINFQFSGAKFDCKWLLLALKVLEVLYYGNFVRVVLPFGTQSTNR